VNPQSHLPNTFLGPEQFATVGGCVMIVFLVTNGISYAFGWAPRYLGLLLALLTTLIGVAIREGHGGLVDWLMAIPNGFLVYAGAAGVAGMTSPDHRRRKPTAAHGPEEIPPETRRFLQDWF
jgi:zinc transporter ZupT